MAGGGKKKRSTNVATKRKRALQSKAAKKGWETRRAREREAERARAKRSKAAKKAAAGRKARELERLKREEHARRSRIGKKAAETRRAKAHVKLAYGALMNAYARGASAAEMARLRDQAHATKYDLAEAVSDRGRYLEILEDIAEDLDTDWHIAYGPGGEE